MGHVQHGYPNVFVPKCVVGLVGLQAAVMAPHICKGLVLLNISLRMLHIKKQPPLARPLIKSFQSLLRYSMKSTITVPNSVPTLKTQHVNLTGCHWCRNTALGKLFFRSVATPQSVRNILFQVCTPKLCYLDMNYCCLLVHI